MKEAMPKAVVDSFGNNINFSDNLVGEVSVKGLIGKWVKDAINMASYPVKVYYTRYNKETNDMVRLLFDTVEGTLSHIEHFVLDMCNPYYIDLSDVIKEIYGLDSDEVIIFGEFIRLNSMKDSWGDNTIVNIYTDDIRLLQALKI